MRKAEIIDGKVVNIIEVDTANVPDWCRDWPDTESDTRIGHIWDGASFREPPVDIDAEASRIRSIRRSLLENVVDPIAGNVLRWDELHPLKKQEIIDYRKALLDVPSQTGFPLSVEWPMVPVI